MAFADDLLKDAHHLAKRGGRNPRQSSLRRAVSTAYYAVFHLLISDFVAAWPVPEQRARLGRMFEHRKMTATVVDLADKHNPTPVETKLRFLVSTFTQLQKDRNEADYNVARIWTRTDATQTLDLADELFSLWREIRKDKAARNHLMSMLARSK
jgi:hypothetical protein